MVQLAALLLGFPTGYFIGDRRFAFVALGVPLTVLLIVQTIAVGHDDRIDIIYWVIQAITSAVAVGLVTWGRHVAAGRRSVLPDPS